MTALAEHPTGEGYPPSLRRQRALFRELDGAIDDGERAIARHFKAFATAISGKLPVLVGPLAALSLDEYSDAVDDVLSPELAQLQRELTLTVSVITRRTMQVGAAHGQSLLGSITVDWDINQPEADAFLKKHVMEMAKGLDTTTRERLAVIIRRGVREGAGVAQIQREIMDAARSMSVARARAIAQTEVIRGFSTGSVQVYKKSGVVQGLRWVAGQFGACPFCKSLHGKIIRLEGGEFGATVGERTLNAPYPPAHVACRCAVAPVLEDVSGQPTAEPPRRPTREPEPSGESIPASFRTAKDAEAWAKARYPDMAIDFTGAKPEALQPVLAEFERLAREYPGAARLVKSMKTAGKVGDTGFLSVSPATNEKNNPMVDIRLGIGMFGSPAKFRSEMASLGRSGYLEGSTIKDAMTHEFAHIIDIGWMRGGRASARRDLADAFFQDHIGETNGLSGYAGLAGANEAWAESFVKMQTKPRAQWPKYTRDQAAFLRKILSPAYAGD